MLESLKKQIKEMVESELGISSLVVENPKKGTADLAIPLFGLVKVLNRPMNDCFEIVKSIIVKIDLIENVDFIAGFLNIYISRVKFSLYVLNEVYEKNDSYGQKELNNKTIVIDYSSPNIAKSFSMGHLRSTMIGNSLKNIYSKEGYNVIGINHLGDWGTQFGKNIVAYEKWGKLETIKKDPTNELQKLYVKFHKEASEHPELEEEARKVFKLLEEGNDKYIALWKWIKDAVLVDLMKTYDRLGVSFDSYAGEAFYNDKMDTVVKELEDKGLLEVDQGASIVRLDNMPPAIIKKSDGTTLYITRDLAALLYRYKTYHFDKIVYAVGNEQKLHFEQLIEVAKKMGYNFDIEHVNFGLVLFEGKKLSTRHGKTAKLDDVLNEAVAQAKASVLEKNPDLKDKNGVAEAVGIGAILFNDLKNERHLDYDLNIESMLKFEGQTGPYLQYSGVRISSILKNEKLDINSIDEKYFNEDHYFDLVKLISQFSNVIERAADNNSPAVVARYLIAIAQAFNHFYGKQKIVVDDAGHKNANLLLINDVRIVLKNGLRLLGIKPLNEM